MTIEEIKTKHMDESGYIYCYNCPLENSNEQLCPSCPDGYENCLNSLCNFYGVDNTTSHEETTEDIINHPSHYTNGGMECIDEMQLIFGRSATMTFCLLNAWKYRKRAIHKNGQEDMDKSDWYIAKYKELKGNDYID